MGHCAFAPSVIPPSMPAARLKGLAMVEQLRRVSTRENVRDGVMLALFVGGIIAWATGFLSGNAVDRAAVADLTKQMATMATQQDVMFLKQQISTLTTVISQVQADLRGMPRADQISVIDRHLSAQDGRMDGMDTRVSDIYQRLSRVEATLQMINEASKATLTGRK